MVARTEKNPLFLVHPMQFNRVVTGQEVSDGVFLHFSRWKIQMLTILPVV